MSYEVMAVEYFKRRLKKLSKKYRRIGDDYKSLIETLEYNPTEGDAIPGFGNKIYKIYKIRMSSTNMKRGKSGGFRVIYYLSNHIVYLLTVYADHGADDVARQVLHACGNIVGFADVRMLVASMQKKKWLVNLVNEFDNEVCAEGGMIR